MRISISLSSLKQTTMKEYALRFVLGGLVTAIVGLVGKEFGPVVGGLFLAFPSIFPAAITLVEKHEAEKKNVNGKVVQISRDVLPVLTPQERQWEALDCSCSD
jgi:hypothetical protein